MTFVHYPVQTDPASIATAILTDLVARGYAPRTSDVVTALAEAVGRRLASTETFVGIVADEIVAAIGEQLDGTARLAGAPASALTTWTFSTATAATIPVGTRVALSLGTALEPFELLTALPVPVGVSTAAGVEVRALRDGTVLNGLTGPVRVLDLLRPLVSVTLDAPSSGGVDPEALGTYLTRYAAVRRLSSAAAITPSDFAALAVDDVQVHRAVALAAYDPAQTPPTGRTGHVTVALADEQGKAVPQSAKDRLAARFETARTVNTVPHLIDATYARVQVAFTFVPHPGADPTATRLDAEQRVRDLIDPALWAGGRETPPVWRAELLVRREDVIVAIRSAPGVDHTTVCTLNGVSADVTLAGPAALPTPFDHPTTPSTVSGTVAS